MKLSEKGQQKILDNFANFIHISHVEFESDDFIEVQPKLKESVVELSIEEAKEYESMIYDFLEVFESQFKDTSEWNYYVILHHLLEKRIEQAEKYE